MNGRFVKLRNRLSQRLWGRADTRMMGLLRVCRNIVSSVRLMIGSGIRLRLIVKPRHSWLEELLDVYGDHVLFVLRRNGLGDDASRLQTTLSLTDVYHLHLPSKTSLLTR
ncbi:hypothetical protein FVEG_06729 [Fusarium verticillioides 7600]|uniref:Uncharacterized protein n=1 Tax=Gibberella moniliformis (strain M3125 / FGSC 7600) TaxID=334819 RepID=W7MND3_GIBM7|nr:hypothetical protein FVEG_06729 [Fusarium verticillioides 7600]EWG46162.1 hypothetical protein FVEG_06729 [Fusarium verticillioides 7600]